MSSSTSYTSNGLDAFMFSIVMPKIYITDFHPTEIAHKWVELDPYYVKKTNTDMIYSDEGIYAMRGSRLFRLFPVDISPKIVDGGFTVDDSYFMEKEVDSQIPYDHIRVRKELLHFCVGKRSGIHLIVEGTYARTASVMGTVTTQHLEDKYYNFTPTDMYFFTQEKSVDNKLFVQEVNVLLSIVR
jgi:hypothetical protein